VGGDAAGAVEVGELTYEAGEGSVDHAGEGSARRGLGAVVTTEGYESGIGRKAVVQGADYPQPATELAVEGLGEEPEIQVGERPGGGKACAGENHGDGPADGAGDVGTDIARLEIGHTGDHVRLFHGGERRLGAGTGHHRQPAANQPVDDDRPKRPRCSENNSAAAVVAFGLGHRLIFVPLAEPERVGMGS
jgi:hypothetical protein